MKVFLLFAVIIAAVGYFGYQYLQDDDCVKSPYTNNCVNTTTGYEAPTYGGGGGGDDGITIGGGGPGITIQMP